MELTHLLGVQVRFSVPGYMFGQPKNLKSLRNGPLDYTLQCANGVFAELARVRVMTVRHILQCFGVIGANVRSIGVLLHKCIYICVPRRVRRSTKITLFGPGALTSQSSNKVTAISKSSIKREPTQLNLLEVVHFR
jgi:hypothetical protein